MGCFWAIQEVPDELLSGGKRILLSRMYLLDNGSRGCCASAELLGRYTGLKERTVDKYRRELEAMGLLYGVPGTRGWHLNLPSGFPPDRATDAEIWDYARRIGEQIGARQTTPPGVANHTPERGEGGPEIAPEGGDSVVKVRLSEPAGLMSTQETHETALMSALLRSGNETHEEEQANPDGGDTTYRCDVCRRPLLVAQSGRLMPCRACLGGQP